MNLSRNYSYTRVAKEDPDERKHRRAQFLIDRELNKSDTIRKRRSNLRLAMSKTKIKVGSRLKRIRKTAQYTISVAMAKARVYKKVLEQLKLWKQRINGEDDNVMMLAPMLNSDVAHYL